MTPFGSWAKGVLAGVGAQFTQTNLTSLYNWALKESGANVLRWNNPLNTTQPYANAVDMNSVHVKRYATLGDGIVATVETLLNGYYPTIVKNLRANLPHSSWHNATSELGKWGTGDNWLGHTSLPDDLAYTIDRAQPQPPNQGSDTVDTEYMKKVDGLLGAVNTQLLPGLLKLQQQMDGVLGAIGTNIDPALATLSQEVKDLASKSV